MDKTDNIFTYIKWRGDLLIKDNPFNEIDALILCEMVYVRFDGVVPGPGEEGSITIADAAKKYKVSKEKNMLYYAEKEELTEAQAQYAEYSMRLFAEKGMIFPFFTMFEGKAALPPCMEDKVYVEYRTNPEHKVKISYL